MNTYRRSRAPDLKSTVVTFIQLVDREQLLGYVLVRNTQTYPKSRAFYKLPGGSRKEDESIFEAAYWECFEECGIDLRASLNTLRYRQYMPAGHYTKHLFVARIDTNQAMSLYNPERNTSVLKPRGNQGEYGYILSPVELLMQITYGGVLHTHADMLSAAGLLENIRNGVLVE